MTAFVGELSAEHFFCHIYTQEGYFLANVAKGALLFCGNLDFGFGEYFVGLCLGLGLGFGDNPGLGFRGFLDCLENPQEKLFRFALDEVSEAAFARAVEEAKRFFIEREFRSLAVLEETLSLLALSRTEEKQ